MSQHRTPRHVNVSDRTWLSTSPSTVSTGSPLDALVTYVASSIHDEAHGRLAFAATEAARIVDTTGTDRTTAFVRLTLAAELAGIGRRHAEAILRDALTADL